LWSANAIEKYAFTCGGSGKIWDREFRVQMGDGTSWSKEWFEQHGERCAVTYKAWPKSVMVQKGDKWVHKHSADDYDDAGTKIEVKPKRRSRSKKIVGIDPASGSDFAVLTTIRGNDASQFIVDDVELLNPLNPTINELILTRSRRVA
jgi:hypothetical protein